MGVVTVAAALLSPPVVDSVPVPSSPVPAWWQPASAKAERAASEASRAAPRRVSCMIVEMSPLICVNSVNWFRVVS